MERKPPQQFSGIFGDVLDPPSHSEHQKIFLGSPQNFLKMGPENAHFSHFEPRKRGSEPRFRVSKCAGISRVKLLEKCLAIGFPQFASLKCFLEDLC